MVHFGAQPLIFLMPAEERPSRGFFLEGHSIKTVFRVLKPLLSSGSATDAVTLGQVPATPRPAAGLDHVGLKASNRR
jgi:hypothetical protein